MRISIGTLFSAAAFASLACVVLVFPSSEWTSVLQNTLGALLLLMLVAAVASRGRTRSFALGFATASLAYIALAFAPMISVRDKLITHRVLEMANEQFVEIPAPAVVDVTSPDGVSGTNVRTTPVGLGDSQSLAPDLPVVGVDEISFFDSGHLLWSLLIGFIGGTLAAGIAASPHGPTPTCREPNSQG